MQPTLCSKCKQRLAVVFISKIENGQTVNEGLCLKCAKDLGLPQVNDMMKRMGITDEDLDTLNNEMMQAFGGVESLEGLMAQEDDDDTDEDGKTACMLAREKNLGWGIRQILENPQAVLAELQQKAQVLDEAGRTQLMLAVADPHQSAIEVYKWLRAGVDVNARDAQGRTALFYINSFCPQKDLKANTVSLENKV